MELKEIEKTMHDIVEITGFSFRVTVDVFYDDNDFKIKKLYGLMNENFETEYFSSASELVDRLSAIKQKDNHSSHIAESLYSIKDKIETTRKLLERLELQEQKLLNKAQSTNKQLNN